MISVESTKEEVVDVARWADISQVRWQRDARYRKANLFGQLIRGTSLSTINVETKFCLTTQYSDGRDTKPGPAFGYYEDETVRGLFRYVYVSSTEIDLFEVDIPVNSVWPDVNAAEFQARFKSVRRVDPPRNDRVIQSIRQQVSEAIPQSLWPLGDGPCVVRSGSITETPLR